MALAALIASSALLLACSSGNSVVGTPGSGPPVALNNYCQSVTDVYCPKVTQCCSAAGFTGTTDATCRTAVGQACAAEIATNQKRGFTYDATAAGNCIASFPQLLDGCAEKTDAASKVASEVCKNIWKGNTAPGGACTTNNECAAPAGRTGYCILGASSTGGGLCTLRPRLGEACSTTGDSMTAISVCEEGLHCTKVSARANSYVCTTPAAKGEPCDFSSCTEGLNCDRSSHVCVDPIAIGGSCTGFLTCVPNAYCDVDTKLCAATLADGVACKVGSQCSGRNCHKGICGKQNFIDDSLCKKVGGM
ncbi:MAG: hypothetical protein NVS3B20_01820 [Polyangiales bacterium]